jgi:hypothetical protein
MGEISPNLVTLSRGEHNIMLEERRDEQRVFTLLITSFIWGQSSPLGANFNPVGQISPKMIEIKNWSQKPEENF